MASEDVVRTVHVSAPGKVILHGEHSVVYGKRAVALSLDLRTHVTVAPTSNVVSLDLPDVDIKESWSLDTIRALAQHLGTTHAAAPTALTPAQSVQLRDFLGISEKETSPRKLALLSFLHLYLAILPQPVPVHIAVNSQLPTGAGLGSSAAYAVCLSGALLHLAGTTTQDNHHALDTICQWAFRSEQIVHGTPSGIDNSICTYGGAVNFKDGRSEPVEVAGLRVLLVNTGVPRSTKALVAGVRERRDRFPEVVDPILQSMDSLAERGVQVIGALANATTDEERDIAHAMVGQLVAMNHAMLCALGVSHPSLERLVGIARANSLDAKLTGAGGGGFGIVVVPRDAPEDAVTKCRRDLEAAGYQVWATVLGAPGFTLHQD